MDGFFHIDLANVMKCLVTRKMLDLTKQGQRDQMAFARDTAKTRFRIWQLKHIPLPLVKFIAVHNIIAIPRNFIF
jgi:hypothetical protein